jgi:hypothetical protein
LSGDPIGDGHLATVTARTIEEKVARLGEAVRDLDLPIKDP